MLIKGKNLIYSIFLFFLSFCFINFVSANSYFYPYVCETFDCYNTKLKSINPEENGYFLTNTSFKKISNLKSHINKKLKNLNKSYENRIIKIEDFSKNWREEEMDKYDTLTGVLSLEDRFYAEGKTYSNGKDYFFSNFKSIIDQLHYGLPIGQKPNNLSDAILEEILSYNEETNKFIIRNSCVDNKCHESEKVEISFENENEIKFINGDKKNNNRFVLNSFIIDEENSVIKNKYLKAGGVVDFEFSFLDYLDASSEETNYNFVIGYKNTVRGTNLTFWTGTLIIDQNFNISSPDVIGLDGTVGNLDGVVELDVLNPYTKRFRITLKQYPDILDSGKMQFYLGVKNNNTGEEIADTYINSVESFVLPNDQIGDNSTIKIPGFNLNKNNTGYNEGDTFAVTLNLKDIYGNEHFDNISGYDIKALGEDSDNIELSRYGEKTYTKGELKNVKSQDDSPYKIYFKFKIEKVGYHEINGFSIKAKKKNGTKSYIKPYEYTTYEINMPNNFYKDGSLRKMYIKPQEISDFPLFCTNKSITISTNCKHDNMSGCDDGKNQSKIFDEESDNGKSGRLRISDHAYNERFYNYNIDHIDQTPPKIKFWDYNGTSLIGEDNTVLANSDPLKIKITDEKPGGCRRKKQVDIKIFGDSNSEKTYTADSDGIFTLDNTEKMFEKSGVYNVKISVTDDAGNTTTKTKKIKVIPNNNIHIKYDKIKESGKRHSDGNTEITTYFEVKDEFQNNLFGSNLIDSLDIGTNSVLNEIYDSGEAFYIKDYSKDINNGKFRIKFVLYNKSSTPFNLNGKINIFDRRSKDETPYYTTKTTQSNPEINFDVADLDENTEISNIMKKSYFSGKNMITLGYDLPLYIKIPTECNESKEIELKDINLKLNLNYFASDSSKKIENMNLVGGTGYVEMINDLKSGLGYNLTNSVKCGEDIYLNFTGRFETKESISSPKFEVKGNMRIKYNLNGADAKKTVVKKMNIENKLKINYWGVDVVGMYSNAAKGLYELMRKGKMDMGKSATNVDRKYKSYNDIVKKSKILIRDHKNQNNTLNNINGKYYYKDDVTLKGGEINGKSLIFVEGGNVYIEGDIRKSNAKDTLTIVCIGDNQEDKGKILIDSNISNIDAAIITENGIHSYKKISERVEAVKGNKNDELKNQLVIYGFILSKGNTIGGSIAMNGKYVLPGGKEININNDNYYKAGSYDLNFLRRYHYYINPGEKAEHPTNKTNLNTTKYGSNPVVIFYDTAISGAYGF